MNKFINHAGESLSGRLGFICLTTVLILSLLNSHFVFAGQDALSSPSVPSELAPQSLLLDISQAGERLVAVGERGHIIYSDDQGQHWEQADVPVRVTLTAVYFSSSTHGWAVGHDGVVLASVDGGESWQKQLDGNGANAIMLAQAEALLRNKQAELDKLPGEQWQAQAVALEELEYLVEDAGAFSAEGSSRPLLDVWFKNIREGWVVGAFGLVLQTLDGGVTWQSALGRLDNPDLLHHYAITEVGQALLISGEAGSLYRSMDRGDSWEQLEVPYDGSLFGLVGQDDLLLAYGLRGNAFRSTDLGDSWHAVDTSVEATLAGGTRLSDGSWVLVGSSGVLLTSDANGNHFKAQSLTGRRSYSAVVAADGALVLVGQAGVQRLAEALAMQEKKS